MELKEFMKEQQKTRRTISKLKTENLDKIVEHLYIFLVEAKTELKRRSLKNG